MLMLRKIQATGRILTSGWPFHLAAARNLSHLSQRTPPKHTPVKSFDDVSRLFFSSSSVTIAQRKHAHVDQNNTHTPIFSKTVMQCENYVDINGSVCPDDRLIGAYDSIDEAMSIIKKNVTKGYTTKDPPENLSGRDRICPLGISRLARGGKTTLLMLLFARLKEEGYAPILLNFNGDFELSKGETSLQAFLRVLATELGAPPSLLPKITQKHILDHINSADNSHNKGVVLLVDELNKLQYPIDSELGRFLKKYFLDKAGRYLVFTTHRPMDVDTPMSTDSGRTTISLTQPPQTSDMEKINAMPSCESVSGALAVYYGRIPSLIYSAKHGFNTLDRAKSVLINTAISANNTDILSTLVAAIFNGERTNTNLDSLGVFVSGNMQWPPCYIGPIMRHFAPDACRMLGDVVQHLWTHSTSYESGKDWEHIVHIAIILRCMNTLLNRANGPLSFKYVKSCSDVQVIELPSQMKLCDDAKTYINKEFRNVEENAPIFLITVPLHAKFEIFDGFLSFGDAKKHKTIGYQCKLSRGYPTKEAPEWLESAFLVRGEAPDTAGENKFNSWEYMTEHEIKNLLGRDGSLAPLYPNTWPEHGER